MLKSICRLLPCLAFVPASLWGQSSVWKISKGDHSLYIGGTCHVLRPTDYPLPAEFDLAYTDSDQVVFEIDPASLQDPAFGMSLMQSCSYTDGRSLKTVLSPKAYAALAAQGKQSNLPIEVLDGMKPGMAVMLVSLQEMMKLGVSQEGVDLHYAARADADGKTTGALETAEFQVQMIAAMGEGNESEFVLFSLQDMAQIPELFEELIASWRSGDLSELNTLFIDDMKQCPALYQEMLVKRNRNWLPKLVTMLTTPETEFVLVGVGHAVGEDGLLALLKAKGYTVEQVTAP